MKLNLKRIIDLYPDEEFLVANGFDQAIIGVENESMRLIYSVDKCIKILMKRGMTSLEAREFFDFNLTRAYMGEKTPIWCEDYL